VFLDLSVFKLLVLGVLALVIFGPDRLPGMAAQAGRALREIRKMAEGAKSELQDSLGPEFSQFDLAELNPKYFVKKHLLDELNGDGGAVVGGAVMGSSAANGNGDLRPAGHAPTTVLGPGESPPYDDEAT
jgi:sec-independent protein translocase protein TatB